MNSKKISIESNSLGNQKIEMEQKDHQATNGLQSSPSVDRDMVDSQISSLEKKMATEKQLLGKALQMKPLLKDNNALQELETSIAESRKRMEFLEGEMRKLVIKKAGVDVDSDDELKEALNAIRRRSFGNSDYMSDGGSFDDPRGKSTDKKSNLTPVIPERTHDSLSPPAFESKPINSPSIHTDLSGGGIWSKLGFKSISSSSLREHDFGFSNSASTSANSIYFDANSGVSTPHQISPGGSGYISGSSQIDYPHRRPSAPNARKPSSFLQQATSYIKNKRVNGMGGSHGSLGIGSTTFLPRNSSSLSSLSSLSSGSSMNLLTPNKIELRLHELRLTLENEQKVKAGAEKLHSNFSGLGSSDLPLNSNISPTAVSDKSSEPGSYPTSPTSLHQSKKLKSEAEKKLRQSSARITLLKSAIHRYQGMYVDGLSSITSSDIEKMKLPVSGRLKMNFYSAINLIGKKSVKTDTYVMIRVDGIVVGKTRLRSKLLWNEEVEVKLNRASDIEISICDKSDTVLAFAFFKLARLKKELSGEDFSEYYYVIKDEKYENVFDLDPSGLINIKFEFVQLKPRALMRNAGVKKRKYRIVNDHRFDSVQFYGITKCALSGEYLMTGTGFRCELCGMLVSKKHVDKVVTKCANVPGGRDPAVVLEEMSKTLRHNVPHRWNLSGSLSPAWCCHCGHMLPIGTRKSYEKCSDCNLSCHSECQIYIPHLCGMSLQVANEMLAKIFEIEKTRAEKARKKHLAEQGLLDDDDSVSRKILHRPSLDDFNFVAVLGKGNFGKVMLGEEKSTKYLYAIKVLKKEFIIQNDELESTRSEKRVFQAINRGRHPFLVNLHSCFQTETRVYFVMEYISGGDLMLHIQREQFSEKRAKFYACEVLSALEFLHTNDIIYRDLKLDNILLTMEGHIKIADYGLCKEKMNFEARTNTFCGTPEFMAPEILLEQPYGKAVDWWALGVLIYEMILGQSPFKGQDEDEIFESIIQDDVLYPSNLNREAVSVMQMLLVKDPRRRLGSSRRDAQDIKSHPYFRGINWEDVVNKKITPPCKPRILHQKDVSNFDEEFTRELPVLTPLQNDLKKADQEQFRGFTYVAEWLSDPKV